MNSRSVALPGRETSAPSNPPSGGIHDALRRLSVRPECSPLSP
jgi:hypothetical protein